MIVLLNLRKFLVLDLHIWELSYFSQNWTIFGHIRWLPKAHFVENDDSLGLNRRAYELVNKLLFKNTGKENSIIVICHYISFY